jgi:hypothetical protein
MQPLNENSLNFGGLQAISEEASQDLPSKADNDLMSLLNKREFSDVTLMVDGKPIYAHQVILASRSTYFEALFTHDFSEKDLRVVDFNDSGISYDQMMQLLKHIYSDNMKIESKFIYDLLSVSSISFFYLLYFSSLIDMISTQ